LPEDYPEFRCRIIPIERMAMTCKLPWGVTIPLRPFFGILAVAPPPNYGLCTSVEPREFGGNLDNKEFLVGTSLYLPVFVPGANFSCGDGHAVQGDGEVCLTALETCLVGTFELVLHKKKLDMPRAVTPTHYITMGLDPDLDDAAKQALRDMMRLAGRDDGLELRGGLRVLQPRLRPARDAIGRRQQGHPRHGGTDPGA
jgi:acetamidase/formamidase